MTRPDLAAAPAPDTDSRWAGRTALPGRPTHRARARMRALREQPGRLAYLTMVAVLFFSGFPLYYSFVVASRDNSALAQVPPPVLPGANLVANVERVFATVPFGTALWNSAVVSVSVTASVVFFSTLAGFAFAKLEFKGAKVLLLAVVATMMVPVQLGVIPLFMLMVELEWTDTLWAVIAPGLVSAFGVFFMTQYLRGALPGSLIESARMDGASTFRIFWQIVLPAARPAAVVLGVLTFLTSWNDYFWPLIVLSSPEQQTVQVALSTLSGGYVTDQALVLTGTMLATLPLLAVFALLGKYMISGIMQGAVKG
ncbi:carbohydrate ABC transporter permease [Glycomyces algeriensis]|uniref:Sugar ABC transporter permease n=1 Tax=Glycomyces algeriensis TaxID=256037 RepID=A0A9W6LHS4_9ACTN|nr:carbohydrate ABC transporter permease [Glycomyces algeriensis]MDA1367452.1 carbohydrate ABC transporter permease [Glycomyces algeriensis]MDR7350893.1 cellobiose transport system permease protein [Glycomyces algeriensis]GLI43605.1 sugar ABC transporter permease [Glycomyces algeriensis]